MPQHKSAAKRVRQNAKRRLRNRYHRSQVRTMVRKLRTTYNAEEAQALFPPVQAMIDRLAAKGILHPNKAANYKRVLARHVRELTQTN